MLFLIEKQASETRSTIAAFLETLAPYPSGGCLKPLDSDLWESRCFQGREFVRLVCQTDILQQFLAQASTGSGIPRDVLQCDRRSEQPVAWLIHQGQKSPCDPYAIETICEKCRKSAPTNALSDIGPPAGNAGQRMWHLCRPCEDGFSVERDRFIQELPPAARADSSKEQRQAAAENWRQDINTHMRHWVLGNQPL
jgi:hypothetical protein